MSDDDPWRRRAPGLAALGLIALVGGAFVMRQRVLDEYKTFAAFCGATHAGEEWGHVQERAASHGWSFEKRSREGVQPEEWVTELESFSYRSACVVTLAKGRVVRTRVAGLPD